MPVALVTDSTSTLTDLPGIGVIPLNVMIDARTYEEGHTIGPEGLAHHLKSGAQVRTGAPSATRFAETYKKMAAQGATEIVSIHISEALSQTALEARTAAATVGVRVHVVDSRTVGGACVAPSWRPPTWPSAGPTPAGSPRPPVRSARPPAPGWPSPPSTTCGPAAGSAPSRPPSGR